MALRMRARPVFCLAGWFFPPAHCEVFSLARHPLYQHARDTPAWANRTDWTCSINHHPHASIAGWRNIGVGGGGGGRAVGTGMGEEGGRGEEREEQLASIPVKETERGYSVSAAGSTQGF